jgi:hypothetical protein
MAIPDSSRDAVLTALATYDHAGVEYAWPSNKFALVFNGRPYPPKVIVSMATGLPVSAFSGGEGGGAANPWLRKRGFTVERMPDAPLGNTKRVVQTTEESVS